MDKMVGLSRVIKPEWLSKIVELISQTTSEQELKERLNEYLSFEIKSPTNLRKTREILLNIWYKPIATQNAIWKRAINAFQSDGDNKLAINWAMILLAYPVFADVCRLIGKISMMQDTFTTAWLREKLLSVWGERTTLYHSSEKILQTLKCLGVIENVKVGVYKIHTGKVADKNTVKVLLMTLLSLNKKAYYEIYELSRVPMYFPFEYNITLEWLHNTPEFAIENFGGKMVVSAAIRSRL
jgi:hypothetical protein